MTDQLKPQPMTPEEISDLVERTRAASRRLHSESSRIGAAVTQAKRKADPSSRSMRGVALVLSDGLSISEAARAVGLTRGAVLAAWTREHPDKVAPRMLSRGAQAARWMARTDARLIEAAREFGIGPFAVRQGWKRAFPGRPFPRRRP